MIPVHTVPCRILAKNCRHIPVEPYVFATLRVVVSSDTLVDVFINVTENLDICFKEWASPSWKFLEVKSAEYFLFQNC